MINIKLQTEKREKNIPETQPCPFCGFPIGVVAGTKDATCTNCGFKDPCCE